LNREFPECDEPGFPPPPWIISKFDFRKEDGVLARMAGKG
jgi:hypothetical protein